ncbi:oxidoreductase-like protein [Trichophaea hybrida]|nr:oxidoreductase-like protein [Trichophaea hybrida]
MTLRLYTRRFSSLPRLPIQARPLTGFYLDLLAHPLTPANPSPPRSFPPRDPTPAEHMSIVFGSPLTGPAEEKLLHEASKRQRGQMIAGIWVPPKPVEPDNCCMSGCVNCVLSTFVEDLEEWQRAKRSAEMALKGLKEDKGEEGGIGLWEGYEDIPVGLRVFMETEKRLKEKEKRKGGG